MDRPRYVQRDNEIVYKAPYLQKDALLSSFIVSSPRAKQQAILDRELNAFGAPFRYRAILDHVALVLADIGQVRSLDPADANKGWVSEVDVCWWILAAAEKDGRLDHLAWYIPYIWVDNPYTMVNGRESFGFPKSFAWSRIPKTPKDVDELLWADALVLPTYTPDTQVSRQRILELARTGESVVTEVVEGARAFAKVLAHVFDHAIEDAALAAKLVAEAMSAKMPVVYLKQFRDVVDPNGACYQALIESNTTIHGFHGAGLLPFDFQLRTFPMASVDVARDLGFATTTDVAIAMWAKLDFSVDLGREIWRAPL